MPRRDVSNEVIVALAAIGMLALALTFGVVLTLSRTTATPQVSPTVATVESTLSNASPAVPTAVAVANTAPAATVPAPTRAATSAATQPGSAASGGQTATTQALMTSASNLLATAYVKVSASAATRATGAAAGAASDIQTATIRTATALANHQPTLANAQAPTGAATQAVTIAAGVASDIQTATIRTATALAKNLTPAGTTQASSLALAATRPATQATAQATTAQPPTNTATATKIPPSPTLTFTNTPLPTDTPTFTPIPTDTPTDTPTATDTATPTDTPTPTLTSTPTTTPTTTPTPTRTPPLDLGIIGQTLEPSSPQAGSAATPTPYDGMFVEGDQTSQPGDTAQPVETSAAVACVPRTGWIPYVVQPGDTLFSLSRRAGITLSDMQQANCLANPSDILVGQVLVMPPGTAVNAPSGNANAGLCPNPDAHISGPASESTLSGIINVSGTASGTNFRSYRLDFLRDGNADWIPFGQFSTPVTNGLLGRLDPNPGQLPAGRYSIRLMVTYTSGAPVMCTIRITLAR